MKKNKIKYPIFIIVANLTRRKIIDIYEPFPNDLLKRNTFYKKMLNLYFLFKRF